MGSTTSGTVMNVKIGVILPGLGQGLTDAVVIEVHVKSGQRIDPGSPLITYETDKAVHTLEADCEGMIVSSYVELGQRIRTNELLFEVAQDVDDWEHFAIPRERLEFPEKFIVRQSTPDDYSQMWSIWRSRQLETSAQLAEQETEDFKATFFQALDVQPPFGSWVASDSVSQHPINGWVSILPFRNNPAVRMRHGEVSLYVADADSENGPAVLMLNYVVNRVPLSPLRQLWAFNRKSNLDSSRLLLACGFVQISNDESITDPITWRLVLTGNE